LPIGEVDVLREDSLIYASKVVVVDGVSLIVRSKASLILPPQEKNTLIGISHLPHHMCFVYIFVIWKIE